jgi:WD40 repeat protein
MRILLLFSAFCISFAFSQYSLKTEQIGGAKDAKESNTFRATLMKNGSAVSTVERKLPYDVPFPSVCVNEATGIFILSYTFDGFVEVYSITGKKLWEENFFKEMSPNYERTITVALGNSSIAFLTSDVTLPTAIVHRYTVNGRKEWETSLPHSMGYEIAMSKDERTIVAGSYFVLEDEVRRTASVLNAAGTVTGTTDILFRHAAFSEDGSTIALASEREVVLFSIASQKESARGATAPNDRIINNVAWQQGDLVVQESSVMTTTEHQFYCTEPTFIRFNSQLKEQSRQTIDTIRFKRSALIAGPEGLVFRPDSGETILLR